MTDAAVMLEALDSAIRSAGSQTALARICNVTQAAVSDWVNRMKRLPGKHALAVERETGVSRHRLAPDLYPREDAPRPDSGDGVEDIAA